MMACKDESRDFEETVVDEPAIVILEMPQCPDGKEGRDCVEWMMDPTTFTTDEERALGHIMAADLLRREGASDEALETVQLARTIAEVSGFRQGEAEADLLEGEIRVDQYDYGKSMTLIQRAVDGFDALGMTDQQGDALNALGFIHYQQGNLNGAMKAWTEAMSQAEEKGDKTRIATLMSNMGVLYENMGEYEKALQMRKLAITIFEELDMPRRAAHTKVSMAYTYLDLGQLDESLNLLMSLEAGIDTMASGRLKSNYHRAVVQTQMSRGEHRLALAEAEKAYEAAALIDDRMNMAGCKHMIGECKLAIGQDKQAIAPLLESIDLYREMQATDLLAEVYNDLSRAYKSVGDSKNALAYMERYGALRDSLLYVEQEREMIRMQYEQQYRQQQIADSVAYAKERQINDLKLQQLRQEQESKGILGRIFN